MTRSASPITCAEFDAAVDELAVDAVDEPRRSALLSHAATCDQCQRQLDGLAALADQILLLAPAVEPPPGFESRALAAMAKGRPSAPARGAPLVRRVLFAAAVVAALLAGVVAGRMAPEPSDVRQAPILAANGAAVGVVELAAEPRPHVLITVDGARPAPGVRSCELELPDGRRVVVGSWAFEAIADGAWAVGIDKSLLAATEMRILNDDGTVLATARFD